MAEKRRSSPPRKSRVSFSLLAPQAKTVLVTGSFCDWQVHSIAMKNDKSGTWKKSLRLPPGRHEYRFLVDGEWHDDPQCPERVPNPFGTENCVLHILREHAQEERAKTANEDVP